MCSITVNEHMSFFKSPVGSTGFTLIELLVTITIMSILLGGAIVGFIRFNDRQQALTTAKDVQQMLRLVQSKATAQTYPQGSGPTANCDTADPAKSLRAYRFSYVSSSRTFSAVALCGDSMLQMASGIPAYTPPANVTINSPASNVSIDFFTLQGGVSGANTFTFTGGGRAYTFNLGITGAMTNVQ